MRRRQFITLLGSAAAWPLAARAQKTQRVGTIGVLLPYAESDTEAQSQMAAFRESLRQLGWSDGSNLRSVIRWTGSDPARIRAAATELVELKPDVILSRSTGVTAALLLETRTLPIVFVVVSDPVGDGFVASMARPAGNATGFTNVEASLGGKWLELLKEISPSIKRVAVMFGVDTAAGGGSYYLRLIEDAAALVEVKAVAVPVQNAVDVEKTIEIFMRNPSGAMIVAPDLTTSGHRAAIIAAAARHRLPTIYPFPYAVTDGGLLSYGVDATDIYRRAATYVDRILRGAKPADLPVQAPTKFKLAINLKTAKALGLDVPPILLARADEVIE